MKQTLQRHAARMIVKHAAVNWLIVARLPHRTPEEIERQKQRRQALYESLYQAKQILAKRPARPRILARRRALYADQIQHQEAQQ